MINTSWNPKNWCEIAIKIFSNVFYKFLNHLFLYSLLLELKIMNNGVASFGFNYGGNFVVKRTQAGVVLGWVTSQEVPVLHSCEHHLDPMSVKFSIYSHEIWIHVESLLMKHGSSSLTQKSHS